MMHLSLPFCLSLCFVCVLCFKLNTPKVLLPYNVGIPSNFTLFVTDLKDEACLLWKSSHPEAILVIPDNATCSKSAVVSAITNVKEANQVVVSVSEKGGERTVFCDISISAIHSLHLLYRDSRLTLGGPPMQILAQAKDDQGHTFSSFSGLECTWNIKNEKLARTLDSTLNVIRLVSYSEQPYQSPCHSLVYNKDCDNHTHGSKSSALFIGENIGTAEINVALVSHSGSINSPTTTLTVSSRTVRKPFEVVYLLPNTKIDFYLHTDYGQPLTDLQYELSVQDPSVIVLENKSVLSAISYGHTNVIANIDNQSYSVDVHVVEPSFIKLTISPGNIWTLHEATSYEITVNLYDFENHLINPSYNFKVHVIFPARLFHIISSSSNGTHYYVSTVVPGSGELKAEFLGIRNEEGVLINKKHLSTSQKFVIYQAIQLSPSVLLLPSYSSARHMYSIPFKAMGGTSFYEWKTNSETARVSYWDGNTGDVMVNFYDEGDFVITATDTNSSIFHMSAKVSVQPVAEIEVYPTVVEAEVDNDIIIPIGLLGYECKDKKIFKMFDDCSKLDISIEIIEKNVLAYDAGGDFPPFGRGCISLQFHCKLTGHSRINIYYNSSINSLKTTVVVSCHKTLKPIHPVRVAVLAIGTTKEIAFEGGPRPWPLHSKGHFAKLVAEKKNLVNVSLIKDPYRYNKDLHVYKVVCAGFGETKLNLLVGNKPSPTNPNPAKLETSVKVICADPYSVHIKYKSTNKVKIRHVNEDTGKEIVKVPFYGKKTFEVDLWIKDHIGRKFANISSLNVVWKVSDESIAAPSTYSGFETHNDGSSGYTKISRNLKIFEMTGKTGSLTISATLTGYHKYNLGETTRDDVPLKEITGSIDLELVSMRDLYEDTYQNIKESGSESCEDDTCKG